MSSVVLEKETGRGATRASGQMRVVEMVEKHNIPLASPLVKM